jgi:hypothetical protein
VTYEVKFANINLQIEGACRKLVTQRAGSGIVFQGRRKLQLGILQKMSDFISSNDNPPQFAPARSHNNNEPSKLVHRYAK